MNLRYRNNAWRPIPLKEKIYNKPITYTWKKIWIHVQDDIENYIGLDTDDNLRVVSFTGDSTPIKAYGEDVQVTFLKRFMIVTYASGMDRYLYKDGEYNLITLPGRASFKVYEKDGISVEYETEQTSTAVGAEGIVGKYIAKLGELTNEGIGKHTGGIMYRAAFRLFDGSYVLHTIPEYVNMGLQMSLKYEYVKGSGAENDLWSVKFYASELELKLWKFAFADIDTDIVTDLVIFACKNESLYKFDTDTFTDDKLDEVFDSLDLDGMTSMDFKDIFDSVSNDFKKIADSSGWYKIHQVSIKDIQEGDVELVEDIDMKDFYSDYATRETLTVDQFSHHNLSASLAYNYNSRLILGNVRSIFGEYVPHYTHLGLNYPYTSPYTFESYRDTYFLFTIKTESGEIFKLCEYKCLNIFKIGEYESLGYSTKSGEPGTKKYFYVPPVIGYPDGRAEKCEMIAEDGGKYYKIAEFTLKSSTYGNYAYNHSDDFNVDTSGTENNFPWRIEYTELDELVNIALYNDETDSDSNRIQVSEVNNPYYFPAENSYQVGVGEIRAIGTNTEPLSSGQFGEYPLQVFTSKGVWAMMQGDGDVVFSRIVPASSEVIAENTDLISVGGGVIFQNSKNWIFLLSGKEVRQLSNPLDYPQNVDFLNNVNLQYFISHGNIVQLSDYIDTTSLKVYISDAKLGFDKENNELVVTNDDYDYSYLFSFESGFWYKISESYSVLVNNYPFLEGLNSRGLVRISSEVSTVAVSILFVTREQSMDFDEIYKKLDRSLIRVYGTVNSGHYFGYYVFGSDDLYNWQLTAGNDKKYDDIKDIRSSRSHKKWKYYIFVLAVSLSIDSILNYVDTEFQLKANRKLR